MSRIFAFFLLLLSAEVTARSFSFPEKETTLKILHSPGGDLLISPKHVYTIDKKGLTLRLSSAALIADATLHGEQLVLATEQGLKTYDLHSFSEQKNTFPAVRTVALATDSRNRLWIATQANGCFLQAAADSFRLVLNIPGVYTLRSTADSNIWIGTNVGMYCIAGNTMAVTRYAEEGYSGYELPDNLVEKIFPDEASNVWVIMPEHVSFKRSNQYDGEIPSFDFVGARNNDIRTVVSLEKGSYIFITDQGCLLLPSSSLRDEHHHSEVFSENNTHAWKLSNKQLQCPEALVNEPVLYAAKKDKLLYFVTGSGGWTVKMKQLLH